MLVGRSGKNKNSYKWISSKTNPQVPGKVGQGRSPAVEGFLSSGCPGGAGHGSGAQRELEAPEQTGPQPGGTDLGGGSGGTPRRRLKKAWPSPSSETPLQSWAEEVNQRHFWARCSFERHAQHMTVAPRGQAPPALEGHGGPLCGKRAWPCLLGWKESMPFGTNNSIQHKPHRCAGPGGFGKSRQPLTVQVRTVGSEVK